MEERLRNYMEVKRWLEMPAQDTHIDASAHLRRLCQSISRSRLDIELVFEQRPLQMNSERCWRLSMIVFELITNSTRYAFGEGGGTI